MVEYSESIIKAVSALLIILFGLLIANIINNLLRKLLRDVEINKIIKEQLKLRFNLSETLSSIVKYLIYAVTFIIVLSKLGIPTRTLQIVFIGIILFFVVFIILAFKDWIPNLVSGFYILRNKNLKIGDRIKINNLQGRIIKINLIETKIETNNKEIIFIPNSSITKYGVTKEQNGKSLRANSSRRGRHRKSS